MLEPCNTKYNIFMALALINVDYCAMFSMLPGRAFKSNHFRGYSSSISTSSAIGASGLCNLEWPPTTWKRFLPGHLVEKADRRLDLDVGNPVGILVHHIKSFFQNERCKISYYTVPLSPVSVYDNFDKLLVPYSHPSRAPRESFYIGPNYPMNYSSLLSEYRKFPIESLEPDEARRLAQKYGHDELVMPTHTTFYLPKLLAQGHLSAIYSGQVWRRDSVDSLHYPVFHQLDGYYLFSREGDKAPSDAAAHAMGDLKSTMEGLMRYLFGKAEDPRMSIEWRECSFPFTEPSFEMFVHHCGAAIEVLGCGLIKPAIIDRNYLANVSASAGDSSPEENLGRLGGWAFGIGLERLAMILFGIPDVRLFWDSDERFASQFSNSMDCDRFKRFVRYSYNPPVVRDISFFLPVPPSKESLCDCVGVCGGSFEDIQRRFIEIVKGVGGELVESVSLRDRYRGEVCGEFRTSCCYRITYRAFENLTNARVNEVHSRIAAELSEKLGITIR